MKTEQSIQLQFVHCVLVVRELAICFAKGFLHFVFRVCS